jgi:hypothetical protein
MLSEVLLTVRWNYIEVGTTGKQGTKTLDEGGRDRVDQEYPGHERRPFLFGWMNQDMLGLR